VDGKYWKNSSGLPATVVARSDSTSKVLPLRCDAQTRYDWGSGMPETINAKWGVAIGGAFDFA
jgi:hypothetical protein